MNHSTISTLGNNAGIMSRIFSSKTIRTVLVALLMMSLNVMSAQFPVANDLCEDAELLVIGEPVGATFEFASDADEPFFCFESFPTSAGDADFLSSGLWYSFVGTGGETTALVDNFAFNGEMVISVYSGSCDELTCITAAFNFMVGGDQLSATFESEFGQDYLFYISGSEFDFNQAAQANFGGNFFNVQVIGGPANDLCANAEPIECGQSLVGSTLLATNDGAVDFCNPNPFNSDADSPGVWYSFIGDGEEVVMSTISDNTDYDTYLNVYSGSCDDLNCVIGNDDGGGFAGPSILGFTSTAGVEYFVYVTGYSSSSSTSEGSSGNYGFTITCEPLVNSNCANAEAIECGAVVEGSTAIGATTDAPMCGTSNNNAIGLWYSYEGTGDLVTVSTCADVTDFDSKLAVYSGSCDDLMCIAGNDDIDFCAANGTSSEVEFLSEVGVQYSIFVYGLNDTTGDFELSLTCEDPCENVIEISCPADLEISCEDSTDPMDLGMATAIDANGCGIEITVSFEDNLEIGCPSILTRTWFAFDNQGLGLLVECDQVITISDDVPPFFTEFPEDLTLDCSVANNEDDLVDYLNDNYFQGEDLLFEDNCASFELDEYEFEINSVPGECPAVLVCTKEFFITDGCNEVSRVWTVTVVDTEAPEFEDYDAIVEVECLEEVPAPLSLEATDACSGEEYTAEVFESNTGEKIKECEMFTANGAGDDWAFWLPTLFEDGFVSSANFHFDSGSGTFEQYADGTAHLTGNVINDINPEERFVVDFWFENAADWAAWSAQMRSYKDDLGCAAADMLYEDWTYFELVEGFSTLTGTNDLDGALLSFSHYPASYYFGFQLGEGANNKNCNDGFSGWFAYDGIVDGQAVSGNGDINVDADCEEVPQLDCIHDTEFTYLYRVEDECGNSDIAEQTIIVDDMTPPVFTSFPEDLNLSCEEYPVPVADVVAEDNCVGEVTVLDMVEEVIDGECPHSYVVERTWRAIDICGNFHDQTQTINVVDATDPVMEGLQLDEEITVECDAVPTAPEATATDNCSLPENIVLTYNESMEEGHCPNYYTLVRTWTATDECLNTSEFEQVINVQDTTNPTFDEHPIYFSLECDLVDDYTITASDNCGSATVEIIEETLNSGGCMGVLMRIYEATDECGNTTQTEQYITIVDTTDPILVGVPADETLECNEVSMMENGNYFDNGGVTGEDNCMLDVEVEYSEEMEDDGDDCENSYIIIRTWIAEDYCGNMAMEQQTITVVDTTNPTFDQIPANWSIECSDEVPPVVLPEASDNCDDDVLVSVTEMIIDGTCENEYTIQRTYRAVDNCGNEAFTIQNIQVSDFTDPELLIGDDMTIECDQPIPASESSATDNCDEDVLIVESEEILPGDCPQEMVIIRTYTATDNCDNSVTKQQVIIIQDTTDPEVIAAADEIIQCDEDVPAPSYEVSDNCDENVDVEVTESVEPGICPQSYTIHRVYTATDDCDNVHEDYQTITVIDDQAPIFDPYSPEIEMPCDDIEEAVTVTATDNCGTVTITFDDEYVSGSCAGNIIRTYTAEDECENTSQAVQIITLIDNTDPEFTSFPSNEVVECSDEIPGAEYGEEMIDFQDNCTEVILTYDGMNVLEGNCPQNYVNEHTWTITDECDNQTSMTWSVTVQDTTDPILNIVELYEIECDEEIPAESYEVLDNCDENVSVEVFEVESGDSCDKVITRTYIATDACDNSTTKVQTIVIEDNTAPEVYPADDIVQSCDLPVPAADYTTEDNCNSVTVLVTESTDDSNPCSVVITRTYVPTDLCGNVGEPAYQTITLFDNQAPVFDAYEPEIEMPCDDIDEMITVTATDNCNSFEITFEDDYVSGACAGNIIRTYTATDVCQNSSQIVQIITLIDNTDPTFDSFPEDMTYECSDEIPGAEYGAEMIDYSDNCSEEVELVYEGSNLIEGNCPQNYSVEYTWTIIDECDNDVSMTWTVTVQDTTDPILEIDGDYSLECDDEIPVADYEVSDYCDEDVDVVITEVMSGDSCDKTITRTYVATDDCGNSTTKVQTIVILDTQAPILVVGENMEISCEEEVPAPFYTFEDNCNSVTVEVEEVISGGDQCYTIFRTYYAEDSCGNEAAPQSQVINVYDNLAPSIDGPLSDIVVSCPSEVPSLDTWTVSDNCDPNPTVETEEVFISGPDECGNYVKEVTCIAYDACGNYAQPLTFTVTVEDNIDPEMEELEDLVIDCEADIPAFVAPLATDNCGGAVEVDYNDEYIGDLPNPEAENDCVLMTPEAGCDIYDQAWSLVFTDGFLEENSDYEYYTLLEGQWLDFDNGTANITATVESSAIDGAGWYINASFENALTYEEWTSQDSPTGVKSDCYDAGDNVNDWIFYIMSNGAYLEGWGAFAGSYLELAHAPSNHYFGYQLGNGANNQSEGYGSGGWFQYEGIFVDSSNDVYVDVDGAGDLSFEHDCCPQYYVERTYCAIDCSGNEVCYTQLISFADLSGDDNPAAQQQGGQFTAVKGETATYNVSVTPNPAATRAFIDFVLPTEGRTTIDVYSLAGDKVATIFNQMTDAKTEYRAVLDVTNLADGIYIYQVVTGDSIITERVIVSK